MILTNKGGEDCGVVSKATPQPPLYTLTAHLDDGLARNPSENEDRAMVAFTIDRFRLPYSIKDSMSAGNGQSTYSTISA